MHRSTIKSSLLPFSSYSAKLSSVLGQYFCLGRLTAFEPQSSSSQSVQQLRGYVCSQRQGSHFRDSRTTLVPWGPLGGIKPTQSGTIPNLCVTLLWADEVPFRLLPTPYGQGGAHSFCDFIPDGRSPFPLFPRSVQTRTRVPFVRLRPVQVKPPCIAECA